MIPHRLAEGKATGAGTGVTIGEAGAAGPPRRVMRGRGYLHSPSWSFWTPAARRSQSLP